MAEVQRYERFPVWMALVATLHSLLIYGLGAYILSDIDVWLAGLYLLYCVSVEAMLLKGACVSCYYYGRVCGLGRGRLCSALFRKGDPSKFTEREFSWLKMLPDLLVAIFPLAGAVVQLIRQPTWVMGALLAALVLLYGGGNAVVRGAMACKYCRQREIGCPAQQMFSKDRGGGKS